MDDSSGKGVLQASKCAVFPVTLHKVTGALQAAAKQHCHLVWYAYIMRLNNTTLHACIAQRAQGLPICPESSVTIALRIHSIMML